MMKSLLSLSVILVLTSTLYGCHDLDKVTKTEDIEKLMGKLRNGTVDFNALDDGIAIQKDSITIDSISQKPIQMMVKKIVLEGHDYWTMTISGKDGGGAGITHSESCWCKN